MKGRFSLKERKQLYHSTSDDYKATHSQIISLILGYDVPITINLSSD